MAQLKRYNGTSWENVGGSVAPKTSQTTSDTDTYSCNYVDNNLTNIKSAIDYKNPDYMGDVVVESIRSKNMLSPSNIISGIYTVGDGTYSSTSSGCCTARKIEIDNTKDYILTTGNTSGAFNIYAMFYNASGTYLDYINVASNQSLRLSTFSNYSNAKYINLRFDVAISGLNKPQFEEGTVATAYSPFQQLGNEDTGWINIQFTSNDWKERDSGGYAPKYRILNNVLYLQGQFATKQALNAGIHVINTTNLPMPKNQYSFCSVGFSGEVFTGWIIGNAISIRTFTDSYSDGIGVAIDGCYPLN